MDRMIRPIDKVIGEIDIPGDKSISHRVVMLGAISKGRTKASNFLMGEDCISTVNAFRRMGVDVDVDSKRLSVSGAGLKGLKQPDGDLDLGNSGTTIRLLSGILAGQGFEAVVTGDESLSRRPMKRILDPLTSMGATIISVNGNGCPPLRIKGGSLNAIDYVSPVASAQVKSCVLLAGLYADGITTVREPYASRDHTERMLKLFGADIKHDGIITRLNNQGKRALVGQSITIPGDISSAAFFVVLASVLQGSSLTIRNVGINPTRTGILDVLGRMGADIRLLNVNTASEPFCDIIISSARLRGAVIEAGEVPRLIDEIPVIAVAAAVAEGETVINGIGELRVKESDRISALEKNLGAMGVDIREKGGNLRIKGRGGRLEAADAESFGDHRIAMAMSIAIAVSSGSGTLRDSGCVDVSLPHFYDILSFVGR